MIISIIMICVLFSVPMCIYFILKRHDWYLFLFPMILLSGISILLSILWSGLSIAFSVFVYIYIIYGFTNKRARNIYRDAKRRKKQMYKDYKENLVDNQTTFKDYILPNGKKVDYIDFNTKTFYLLRPYTENIEKKYKKQINKYVLELEKAYGGNWSYIIDTY